MKMNTRIEKDSNKDIGLCEICNIYEGSLSKEPNSIEDIEIFICNYCFETLSRGNF